VDEQVECVIALNAAPAIRKAVQEHPLRLVVTEVGEASVGAAYNAGIAASNGRYLIFMDCVFAPEVVMGSDPAYAAGKAGIAGLTRSHARLLGPRGIRTSCMVPGVVSTPLWGEEGVDQEWIETVPLGRVAYPEDVAAVIAFLYPDAARYVNGAAVLSMEVWPRPSARAPTDDGLARFRRGQSRGGQSRGE